MMPIKIDFYYGRELNNWLDFISCLRVDSFKEFPYLYAGDIETEVRYLEGYTADNKSILVLAKENEKVIGISTGVPLDGSSDIVQELKILLKERGVPIEQYYYCGEVIVLPAYRQKGVAKKIISSQEMKIAEWGYKKICLLTVVREQNDRRKPKKYFSTDHVWKAFGFLDKNIYIEYKWPTIMHDGIAQNVNNKMLFWEKSLNDTQR